MCFYEVGYFSCILSYLNERDTKHTVHWIKERFRRWVLTFQCHITEKKDSGSGISPEPLGHEEWARLIKHVFSSMEFRLIPVATRSKARVCDRLLAGIAISNPTGAWMSVSYECCVFSGRGLCDGLIRRSEGSYSVCVCHCCDQVKQ